MEALTDVFNAINSPDLQHRILFLKVPFLMISVFFIGISLYVFMRTSYVDLSFIADVLEFFQFHPYGVRRIGKRWKRIMARLDTGNEAEYKLAIIEADTILDGTLVRMGLDGDTADERVAKLTSIMVPNLDALRTAHEARNEMVHNPDMRLTLAEARRILEEYAIAFRGLDLMQ